MNAKHYSMIGGLFALPWCCIVPAGFSLVGLAGVAASRTVAEGAVPFFLLSALFSLGRAHYLIYVKRQGNRTSHVMTWVSTLVAVSVWVMPWII